MGNSNSAHQFSAQDKAVLEMKKQRNNLQQYQKRITVITNLEHEIAKELLRSGDKRRALLALRRKKFQETLLTKTDAQLAQLEMLIADVEFAKIQKDVVFGLQQGTKVLKEIQAEIGGVEQVEKLMGENADAIAYQKEISEMLAGRMSTQEEEEVEDELSALEAEVSASKLPKAPERLSDPVPIETLPNVPNTAGKEPAEVSRTRISSEPLTA